MLTALVLILAVLLVAGAVALSVPRRRPVDANVPNGRVEKNNNPYIGLFVGLLAVSVLLAYFTSATFGMLVFISLLVAICAWAASQDFGQVALLAASLAIYLALGQVGLHDDMSWLLHFLFWVTWIIAAVLSALGRWIWAKFGYWAAYAPLCIIIVASIWGIIVAATA